MPEALELDAFDRAVDTVHIVARAADGQAIGAARLRPYRETSSAKVERVAVLSAWRGQGVGRALMLYLEAEARRSGLRRLALHAQTHARAFYEGLQYEPEGEEFEEAGIAHIAMAKTLPD